MSRVIIATGKLAENPYRIRKIERDIYSVEELCYSLVQSAQFMDASIMDPALVRWIRTETGLSDLASRLQPMLGKERQLSDFISLILDYAGYVSQDKQIRTRQIVSSGQGMEPFEKRMAKASYMAGNGQSYQALSEYEALLADLPEPERETRTRIYVRMGQIYADLFRFRPAAESFRKAFELTGDSALYLKYLGAVRMDLSDAEYIAFISEHPEAGSASLELEKRVQAIQADYEQSDAQLRVERLRHFRDEGQETNYEIALHQTIQKMKDEYRAGRTSSV